MEESKSYKNCKHWFIENSEDKCKMFIAAQDYSGDETFTEDYEKIENLECPCYNFQKTL